MPVFASSAAVLLCALPPAAAAAERCPRPFHHADRTRALRAPIALSRDGAVRIISFGRKRGLQTTDVVFRTSRPLPARIKPGNLGLDLTRKLVRQGDKLVTVAGIEPTFRGPQIAHSRRQLTFTVCVDGDGLAAGRYTGTVEAFGPRGLGTAQAAVSVAVKNATLFGAGVVLALLVAAAAIWLKERDARRRARRRESMWRVVLLGYVAPLAAGLAAAYGVYAKTPAWGADEGAAIIGLVTTALTAIGVRSIAALARGR